MNSKSEATLIYLKVQNNKLQTETVKIENNKCTYSMRHIVMSIHLLNEALI